MELITYRLSLSQRLWALTTEILVQEVRVATTASAASLKQVDGIFTPRGAASASSPAAKRAANGTSDSIPFDSSSCLKRWLSSTQ
eukprot:6045309-Amphidinium_carterae.1